MADDDRERWNTRYAGEEPSAEPVPFVTGLADLLPRTGRALDVAGGGGRHALWLARRGLDATLVDVSDVALERARTRAAAEGLPLVTARLDLEVAPLPQGPWDVILCTYFLHRPLFPALAAALAPGGILAFAHATRRNLERHPRPGPRHVLEEGELHGAFPELAVLRYEEGWLESGRHEARLVARRPPFPGAGERAGPA